MLSSNQIKFIRSLAQKKERDVARLFVAEGPKTTLELMDYFPCRMIVGTKEVLENRHFDAQEIIQASPRELERASLQKTPQGILAVFEQPASTFTFDALKGELLLALDGVQNPGNVGTIIRVADWFGIQHIFCSPDTADAFGPKTVQATMGSLGRVALHYVDLQTFLPEASHFMPVYGTAANGTSIYESPLSAQGIVVFGNEGNGISPQIIRHISESVSIPAYNNKTESLNVAVAAAIICAEFRRRS